MDLNKNGKLLYDLRKAKGMTQKQVADKLSILPKTVSKWETGHGFPDVSLVSDLASVFEVSEKTLLSGVLCENMVENGNVKKTKFYVCRKCGNVLAGTGNAEVSCCGRKLIPLESMACDEVHKFRT